MTVCVAAICQYPWLSSSAGIVAAGDLMLTSGDGLIEFERPVMKVFPIGDRAAILAAGALDHLVRVCEATKRSLNRPQSDNIAKIAERLAAEYQRYRTTLLEQMYLSQYGLRMSTFLDRQSSLGERLADSIVHRMETFDLGCIAIVAGVDRFGAHLYTVCDPGVVTPWTSTGFVAIGSGGSHATSQFMLARYEPRWQLGSALLLTYMAKKKAEIAPGVGTQTSLLLINAAGRIEHPKTEIKDELDAVLREIEAKDASNKEQGNLRVQGFLSDLLSPRPPAGPPPGPGSDDPGANPTIDDVDAVP